MGRGGGGGAEAAGGTDRKDCCGGGGRAGQGAPLFLLSGGCVPAHLPLHALHPLPEPLLDSEGHLDFEPAASQAKGVRRAHTTLAGTREPPHVLLNTITASYLHSSSLRKYFEFGFFAYSAQIPQLAAKALWSPETGWALPPPAVPPLRPPSSVPRVGRGLAPPVLGLRAVEPYLWSVDWGQGSGVKGALCSRRAPLGRGSEPGLTWLVRSDSGWVLGAQRKGLCTLQGGGGTWTVAGSLGQLGARSSAGQRVRLALLKR